MGGCACATDRGSSSSPLLKDYRQKQLEFHNDYRAKHGCPPLTLDDVLNADAQVWAEKMLDDKEMEHATSEERGGMGENLAASMQSGGDALDKVYKQNATEQWYDEIKDYDFGEPGFAQDTGHFTQVVWKSTTKVGFGYAANENYCYVCARYNPPGNMEGDFPDNVPELINKNEGHVSKSSSSSSSDSGSEDN